MGTGIKSITEQKERISNLKWDKVRKGDIKIGVKIETNIAWTKIRENVKEPSGYKESQFSKEFIRQEEMNIGQEEMIF